MATLQQVNQALTAGKFGRQATPQDLANAQKYGLGIFAAQAKKAATGAPPSSLDEQISQQQQQLGQLQGNIPGYLENQQEHILQQNPEYASIQQQRAGAVGQLYSQPFEAAQTYSNVFNPMERDKLISQAVGNVLGRLTGFNDTMANQRTDAKGLAQQALDQLNSKISLGKSNLDALQGRQTRQDKLNEQNYQHRLDAVKLQLEKIRTLRSGVPKPPKYKAGLDTITDPITGTKKNTGLKFSDESGLPITAAQYASGKGVPIDKILANSPDPGDVQKLQDYRDFQSAAALHPDKAKEFYQRLIKAHPETFSL